MPSKICSYGSSNAADRREQAEADRRRSARSAAPAPSQILPKHARAFPVFDEVGEDDADDERRLDAFAQPGEEAGKEEPDVQCCLLQSTRSVALPRRVVRLA